MRVIALLQKHILFVIDPIFEKMNISVVKLPWLLNRWGLGPVHTEHVSANIETRPPCLN